MTSISPLLYTIGALIFVGGIALLAIAVAIGQRIRIAELEASMMRHRCSTVRTPKPPTFDEHAAMAARLFDVPTYMVDGPPTRVARLADARARQAHETYVASLDRRRRGQR